VTSTDTAVPVLARELGRPLPDAARIARLIADLDHARFAVREQAARALLDVGEQAVDPLREARAGKVSAEQAERIDGLLGKLAGPKPSPDRLRSARAVAAVEWIGSPPARTVIREVAKGPASAPRTKEAKAAVDR
jgi:HEAT repeat protein